MTTTQVINLGNDQHVRVPEEFKLDVAEVSIRREGDALIIEPILVTSYKWPKDFFESIRIDDPLFERPAQGSLPPIRTLET